ncbi:hypothetical protein Tco_0931812 [Tanacetum coccineum]
MFVRIGFNSTIELVSFDETQVVTFNGEFICGIRNGDCETKIQSDNKVGIPHGFVIHAIEVLKGNEIVTEVIDVENWHIDNSRLLRWIISLFKWKSSVSWTKTALKSLATEVDINKKTENRAKMTKLSMEWKRLCKIKAKVQKCQSQSQYRRISSQTGAGTEEYYWMQS